jgi:2-haloacid dehalogenase
MPQLSALVFDAYGTLFDVHSVVVRAEKLFPGQGAALSQLWRTKQLEYTWLRSLMGTYENFNVVTREALAWALAAKGLPQDEATLAVLTQEYIYLDHFPEVPTALARLKHERRIAILSNGAPDTLNALVQNSGLEDYIDAVLSVDPLRIYKPDMRVYALAEQTLALPRAQIGFVSSNGWDAAGAATYGFTTFWINRQGAPVETHARPPHHIIQNLGEIAPLLA